LHPTTVNQQIVTASAFEQFVTQFHAHFPDFYVVLARLTQDALESVFGWCRSLAGGNSKMTQDQLVSALGHITAMNLDKLVPLNSSSSAVAASSNEISCLFY